MSDVYSFWAGDVGDEVVLYEDHIKAIQGLKADIERLRGGGWISVDDRLPIFQFFNYGNDSETSQSVELSDGENLARGHLDSKDGWVVYESEYDYFYVDPDKITHWMPLIDLPL